MTPLRTPGRRVLLLAGIALSLSLALVAPVGAQNGSEPNFGVPADAPKPAEGKITRVLTVGVIDEGECPGAAPAPCWDVSTLAANPGDVVVLHANMINSEVPHNLHIIEPGAEVAPSAPGPKTRTAGAAFHTATMTMPDTGTLTFICDVHPETMVGTITTPLLAGAAAGGHAAIPTLGVHFLAYWVGVIAFAILFIVYGVTFFLFKYNETPATTDHWDRSETPRESKRLAAIAPLAAVVLALVGIAAIVFLTAR